MRIIITTGLICSAALVAATQLNAQVTAASDVTNPVASIFSRGFTQAFGAPPAPPPELISTPAMLDVFCIERADAFLMFSTFVGTPQSEATHRALALLKGGVDASQVARPMYDEFVRAGADPAEVSRLIDASNGLLATGRPEVATVATAVNRYNAIVSTAPDAFLSAPPADFLALRTALGELTTAANTAYDPNRVYPGWNRTTIGWANASSFTTTGQAIMVAGGTYLQVGSNIPLADKRLKRVGTYNGAWVLADVWAGNTPKTVYVPVRTECDVALVPFTMQEKVIKR
jgi:hypothetical protein